MSTRRSVPGSLQDGTAAYPWPEPRRGEFDELVWDGLVYSAEGGWRPLFLDLHVPRAEPSDRLPVVVWLHGGANLWGSRRRRSPVMAREWLVGRTLLAGLAVALVDYRLVHEAPFPAPVADVRAAVRWLRGNADELGLDPERVALWGESAGAHLACLAASCDRDLGGDPVAAEHTDQSEQVQAVVDWYGPADLSEHRSDLLEASDWDEAAASPASYARAGLPPILVAHGRDDDVVPIAQSRAYSQALEGAGVAVEYVETAGGHVFEESMGEMIPRALDFLRRTLRAPSPQALDPEIAASPGADDEGTAERIERAVPRDVMVVHVRDDAALEDLDGGRVVLVGGDAAVAAALECRDRGIELAALLVLYGVSSDRTDVSGLPPTIMGVGAHDPRFEESLTLATRLREAGVPLRLRVFPTLGHGFFGHAGTSQAADRASERVCRDLGELLWDA